MLVRRIAVAIGVFGGLAIPWPFILAFFAVVLCDAASCPSNAVLLAWLFSLPIVGVASVLAGILAPWKPVAAAKAFFVAAALNLIVAVLGPFSVGEGWGKAPGTFGSSFYVRYLVPDRFDLIVLGLLAPLVVIPLAMGVSLLRWGKIRHEITFSRAFVKTLLKAAVVYLMAAVLSLLWLVVIVFGVPTNAALGFLFGVPTNAALGFLALMSAIALVIGISLFTRWGKKTQTP